MEGMVLREVRLMGHLAEGIGETLRLAFDTPARALRLIEVNFPGFMQRFKEGYYFVTVVRPNGRKRHLREEELQAGFTGDLIIMPAATGAASGGKRKGLLGALLGAILIGAAFFFSGGALAGALPGFLGATGATFGTIAQLGLGLLLNGVAMMLTPTPNTDYGDVDEKRSFMFNGPTNLSEQGGVVPVIFGTMMVGTTTVSASLDSEFLAGTNTGSQEAKNSRHTLRQTTDAVRLYYGDIARTEQGAVLTKINGQAVTGSGTLTLTALNLIVAYDVAATGSAITGFPIGPIPGFTRPLMQITSTGAPPDEVNASRALTYEFTHGGQIFTGTITVDIGFPVEPETYTWGNQIYRFQ